MLLLISSVTMLCCSAALAICEFMSLIDSTDRVISSSELSASSARPPLSLALSPPEPMTSTESLAPDCRLSMIDWISTVDSWVRLASVRTQDSTTEIESMIGKLHDQAEAAVDAITQGQRKARNSVDSASNAGKALGEITASVNSITSMNLQIAAACEEQSAVAIEIRENVVDINEVASDNATASHRLSSTSESLANIADELQQVVSHFKY